jgi:hypothetical protein
VIASLFRRSVYLIEEQNHDRKDTGGGRIIERIEIDI